VEGQANNGTGVQGVANNGTGVYGFSHTGDGVVGICNGVGYGGFFSGGLAPLGLARAGTPGAPSSGTHYPGEIYLDVNTVVWVCIAGDGFGVGTWVRLTNVANGTTGGATTYLPAPVRLLDARSGASSGLINRDALAGNEIYTLPVAGLGSSGIPSSALGLICNVTVLGPGGNGNLSLFPAGHTPPVTASMTFLTGAFLANGVNTALGSGGMVAIQNQSGASTPLVLDAVAYVS
jgi:hypothetical protein